MSTLLSANGLATFSNHSAFCGRIGVRVFQLSVGMYPWHCSRYSYIFFVKETQFLDGMLLTYF